jgi:hypothetical protein
MRTQKPSLLALCGVLVVATAASAVAAPKLEPPARFVTIILVVVCALFLGGCLWRMSRADRDRDRGAD